MDYIDDPDMREIAEEFQKETKELVIEMQEILEAIEDSPEEKDALEKFGQTVDRIMGAAESLEIKHIGAYARLCKTIGYKASQSDDVELVRVTVPILQDAADLIEELNNNLFDTEKIKNINTAPFKKRLEWLAEKFKDIKRASCA